MIHEFKLPSLGDGVTGKITEIMVKPGDTVTVEQIVMVVGTDKVDAEMPIDVAGIVDSILVKKGDDVKEGDLIMKIKVTDGASAPAPAAPIASPEPATQPPTPIPVVATVAATPVAVAPAPQPITEAKGAKRVSPLARKRAKELGINLSDVSVAADASRVTYKDVIEFAKNRMTSGSTVASSGSVAHKPLPDFAKYGEVERKPMTRINEVVAENLSYTWSTTPHAWMLEKADITHLENLRNQHKERVKAMGGALTTTSILVKAIISVLKKFPTFNATLDLSKKEIVFKNHYHIGVAVDTPRGLLVPVIKDADKKGLIDISKELTELSARTRDGKNQPGDMEGSTFSISNVGGIGSTTVLPIVNWPNSAILGVTAAQIEAIWNESKQTFEPRLMMPLSVAFDHRIINGADASRFLKELKNILEEPFMSWF